LIAVVRTDCSHHQKEEPLSDHPKQTDRQAAASVRAAQATRTGGQRGLAPGLIGKKTTPRRPEDAGTSASVRPADKAITVDRLNASNDD
jgi:hypothetical protein